MNIKPLFLILLVTGIFESCSNGERTASETAMADSTDNNIRIVNDTISAVYDNYIILKDALVSSDSVGAATAATKLAISLKEIHGCENTALISDEIGRTNTLADQRAEFTNLSSDIIAMIKSTNLSTGKIFVQYCPMANEGNGGYWLASNKSIKNPYFGVKMLECGEVKEEIVANTQK
jgi:hypothetical protein